MSAAAMAGAGARKTGILGNRYVLNTGVVVLCLIACGVVFVLGDIGIGLAIAIGGIIGTGGSVGLALVGRPPRIVDTLGAIGLGALLGIGGAAGAWVMNHPTLYVDNAFKEPIVVFVDGDKVAEIGADRHEKVTVARGSRELGWAKKGATKPESTVKAKLSIGDEYLYNPGKSACYWLVVDVYGSASAAGKASGPQRVAEFYAFDTINTWFGQNPDSVSVNKKQKGTTRTALQRAERCMQFRDCAVAVREQLVACQLKVSNDQGLDQCDLAAKQACSGAAAAGAEPAATPPPASTAPKPTTPAKPTTKAATPAPKPAAKPAPTPAPAPKAPPAPKKK
jgi:hypothetical protein